MTLRHLIAIGGLIAACSLLPFCRAADDPAADPLKDKGLTKSGSQYVLADEAHVLDAMKNLRKQKSKLDAEMKVRADLDRKTAQAKAFISQCESRHDELEEKLAVATDPTIHNQIVGQMNLLVIKAEEADKQKKGFEEQAGKVGGQTKADFVDQVAAAETEAHAINAKYVELAADSDVKAALDLANQTAKPKLKIAASSPFTVASNQLNLWNNEIAAESIPLSEDGGVNMVEVLLNGSPHKMVLDTGASLVTLPAPLAEELKMKPGPKDRPIQMKIADGSVIEGRLMKLKSVRVGRFTVQDVDCVVLQAGLNDAPALLGGSFLSHFVVKMDTKAGTLHLVELSKDDKAVTTTTETTPGKKADVPAAKGK